MILSKVRKTIETKNLLEDGDRVLVCVSGGPDSMALLHVLMELRGQYDIEIFVAHLNHALRGRAANTDADFVRKAAADLGLMFIAEKIDVKKIAESQKTSIEEAARDARYGFYSRAAKKLNATKIATGHTLDDQAETVLMRLLKGAGSLGLSGIPYKRRLGDIWVVRPLLDIPRTEIEKYLKRNAVYSRTDASNLQMVYLRNKIRNVLIPVLEKDFNPNVKAALSSIASTLSDESSYLAGLASKKIKRISRLTKKGLEFRIKDFTKEHIALQRIMARQIIAALKGDLKSITYKHWLCIESILKTSERKKVSLPGGIKAVKDNKKITFSVSRRETGAAAGFRKEIILRIPGRVVIPELGVKISAEIIRQYPDFLKKKDKNIEYANGDLVKSHLIIRVRRKGDRMKPLGMKSHKKLQDIFVDDKIAYECRSRVPIVLSGNKILWAAGVKLSDEFRLKEDTGRILKLSMVKS